MYTYIYIIHIHVYIHVEESVKKKKLPYNSWIETRPTPLDLFTSRRPTSNFSLQFLFLFFFFLPSPSSIIQDFHRTSFLASADTLSSFTFSHPFYFFYVFIYFFSLHFLGLYKSAVIRDGFPWNKFSIHNSKSFQTTCYIPNKLFPFLCTYKPDWRGRTRAIIEEGILYSRAWGIYLVDGLSVGLKKCWNKINVKDKNKIIQSIIFYFCIFIVKYFHIKKNYHSFVLFIHFYTHIIMVLFLCIRT